MPRRAPADLARPAISRVYICVPRAYKNGYHTRGRGNFYRAREEGEFLQQSGLKIFRRGEFSSWTGENRCFCRGFCLADRTGFRSISGFETTCGVVFELFDTKEYHFRHWRGTAYIYTQNLHWVRNDMCIYAETIMKGVKRMLTVHLNLVYYEEVDRIFRKI